MKIILGAALAVGLLTGCKCSEKQAVVAKVAAPLPKRVSVGAGLNVDPKVAASTASVQFGMDGQPLVAWREGGRVYVSRWNGTAWDLFGGGPADGGKNRAIEAPVLSIDKEGRPWVAFKQMDGSDVARGRVVRLESSGWKDVGALLGDQEGVRDFAFCARSSPPVFAWTQPEGEKVRLKVRKFEGETWFIFDEGIASHVATLQKLPALAARGDDAPLLVWLEKEPARLTVQVRTFDVAKGAWAFLPAPTSLPDGDSTLQLVANSQGAAVLALSWNAGLRPLQLLAPGALSWAELAVPSPAAAKGSLPRLSTFDRVVALSYWAEGMQVARFDGEDWQVIDPKLFHGAGNAVPVAVSPKGQVYAAWQDTGPEGGDTAQLKVVAYQ